jgi:hypothetical protein
MNTTQIFRDRQVGFFANFLDVIRRISQCEESNKNWHIYWGNESLYFDQNYGNNVWDYFFENTKLNDKSNIKEIYDVPDLIFKENLNFRESINYYINKYIKIKDSILNEIQNINSLVEQNDTLGIHIRRTDKNLYFQHGEPFNAIPMNNDVYIKYTYDLLEKENYNKIFLATDDEDTYKIFKKEFSNKLILKDSFRSSDSISIHQNHFNISGYKKGLDVLTDCVLLSKCKFLLRSTSNVGSTAQFFNLNLKHINVNEIHCGDFREKEFNLISERL